MATNNLFRKWVDEEAGTQAEAARRLSLSPQYINFVYLGRNRVSKRLAVLIENDSQGRYCKAELLWGDESDS